MSSRDEILSAVGKNQPDFIPLPDISALKGVPGDLITRFRDTLTAIGGKVVTVQSIADIRYHILHSLNPNARNITTLPLLGDILELIRKNAFPSHAIENADLAVIDAHFAVAENGAVWVTDDKLMLRVLPFICQHLAVIVNAGDIVPTMHEAYDRITGTGYNFGTFIAGPSKTADIEQSLVLGAHGPRSMTIYLMG